MGVVLAGRHLELGERVAIKFLHREHAGEADRFFREARAAARIRSEHVVRVMDVGRLSSGEPYIVMEHLDGEDLASRLERVRRMSPAQVADALVDVCQALAEAHAVGIVHRDLKPANIFLARSASGDDVVKLLDFGIAKVPEAGSMTRTATMLGSPYYMSPEQLMASRDVDARADIWSLGIILFELLTGELPFEGESLIALGIAVRDDPTPLARARRPELPEALDEVIGRCLAKDRAQRFSDVGELALALAPFLSPGLEHLAPRVKRVLEESRKKQAFASTIPPPSSEPVLELVDERLPATAVLSLRERGSASLVALSSSAETRARQRSKLALGMGLGTAVLALGGGIVAMSVGGSATSKGHGIVSVSAAPVLSEATLPAVFVRPPPEAPVASIVVVAPSTASVPSSRPPPRAIAAPKVEARAQEAALSAGPSVKPVNCNPPYTLDDRGVRHAKSECL
jgi:serine/threonine-protein kinase